MPQKNNACTSILLALQGGERHDKIKLEASGVSLQYCGTRYHHFSNPNGLKPGKIFRFTVRLQCLFSILPLCMAKGNLQFTSMTTIVRSQFYHLPHVAMKDRAYLGCLIGPRRDNVAHIPDVTMDPDDPLGRHIIDRLTPLPRAASNNGFSCRGVAGSRQCHQRHYNIP